MISYMMVFLAFLARMISYQKLWYCIWYHSFWCDIMYDITKTIIKSLSCAIFIEYCLWYHIHILWICPWYQYYAISYLLLRMIYAIDIIITWIHSHTISHILWYLSPYHGTCAAGWRWLGAPGARCSAGSSHAIANMLGTCVQLNCDYLDAVHGLVALVAARVMHCCRVWRSCFKFAFKFQVHWHLANLNAHHIYSLAVIQVLLVAALGSQAQD